MTAGLADLAARVTSKAGLKAPGLKLLFRGVPAAQRPIADQVNQSEQREAQHGGKQHGGEYFIDALLCARHIDHRAEPLPSDEFADDRADHGETGRHA